MCLVDVVLSVDGEAGLRAGAHLTVNTSALTDPPGTEINRDDDMEELTWKMYVLSLSLSLSS